jgi:uncharacterized membrane protein YjjP (DUF1212 family)
LPADRTVTIEARTRSDEPEEPLAAPSPAYGSLAPSPVAPEGGDNLDRRALAEVVELALGAGALLMEHGAESQRVEQTVRELGQSLGCGWGDVLVTQNAIIVTHASGADFRTKLRRVKSGPVDMSLIEALSHLSHRAAEGRLLRAEVQRALSLAARAPRHYGEGLTRVAVAAACAAFCRLFGGTFAACAATFAASFCAMAVRHAALRAAHNPLLSAALSAFVAGSLTGALQRLLPLGERPEAALAASVLLLVPGVPAINAAEDLIKGHVVVGLARAAGALMVVLAATLGLVLAMHLTAARL